MKLLKLTYIQAKKNITVDFDNVAYWCENPDGTGTKIQMKNVDKHFFVLESIEQIDKALDSIFGVKVHEVEKLKSDDKPDGSTTRRLGFGS